MSTDKKKCIENTENNKTNLKQNESLGWSAQKILEDLEKGDHIKKKVSKFKFAVQFVRSF